jgi:hypothetical protein
MHHYKVIPRVHSHSHSRFHMDQASLPSQIALDHAETRSRMSKGLLAVDTNRNHMDKAVAAVVEAVHS